jgi:hypothetical protein
MLRLGTLMLVFLLNHLASCSVSKRPCLGETDTGGPANTSNQREAAADGMSYIEGFPRDEPDMICLKHALAFFVFAWDIEDTFFP